MKFSDEKAWKRWLDANSNPYGLEVASFAQRWATIMEAAMEAGESLDACAERAAAEAATEVEGGITRRQYGAAVSGLARTWKHGVQLMCWYDSRDQAEA